TYLVERALDFPGAMDLLLNCVRNWATRDAAWRRLASHALMTLGQLRADFAEMAAELIDLLEDINPDKALIARACAGCGLHLAGRRGFPNIFAAALSLFQRPDPSPALAFIQALAREDAACSQRLALEQWVVRAAKILDVQAPVNPSAHAATENFLLIRIGSDQTGRSRLDRWIVPHIDPNDGFDPGHTFPAGEIAAEIQRIVTWVYNHCFNQFTLELFVDRHDYCLDISRWELSVGGDPNPVICEVPVVFRSLERLNAVHDETRRQAGRTSAIQEAMNASKESRAAADDAHARETVNLAGWREKCARLQQHASHNATDLFHHIPRADADFQEHNNALREAICVGLGYTPAASAAGRDLLRTAVQGRGAPVAVWFRDLPGDGAVNKDDFLNTLRAGDQAVTLGQLRDHLWQLRRAAVGRGACDHIHHHITLLYDDCNRVPDSPTSQPPAQH
ncbi:MAG: hypothetical protein ACKV2V_17215, partial [Blastocatellia bacterium]